VETLLKRRKRFKQSFEIYLLTSGLNKSDDDKKIAILLYLIGEDSLETGLLEVFDLFELPTSRRLVIATVTRFVDVALRHPQRLAKLLIPPLPAHGTGGLRYSGYALSFAFAVAARSVLTCLCMLPVAAHPYNPP